jgi:regulator of replication initiation timing
VADYRPSDLTSAPQADLAKENERLRLENRVLREVEAAQMMRGIIENRTEILKKATQFFCPRNGHEVRIYRCPFMILGGTSGALGRYAV